MVVGIDDPVPIAPDFETQGIGGVAARIGVARQIQPHPRPALPVAWGRKQPIDETLIGTCASVVHVLLHLLGCWRQTDQVERDTPRLHGPARPWRRLEADLRHALQHEPIDRIRAPRRLRGGAERGNRPLHALEGPVPCVAPPFLDPASQQLHILGIQRGSMAIRRHALCGVESAHPPQKLAAIRVAGNHRKCPAGQESARPLHRIEAQPALAISLIEPVADEATCGQQRPDLQLKVHRGSGRVR